jgi:hypothetical protein
MDKEFKGLMDEATNGRPELVEAWNGHYDVVKQDLSKHGNSFTEIISRDNRVVDLRRLEVEHMYVQRDPNGKALLYVHVVNGIPATFEPHRILHVRINVQPGEVLG